MIARNVHTETGVSLVGGGLPAPSDIVFSVTLAPFLIAADGGANFCIEAGLKPDAVIGDLDSISDAAHAALPPDTVIEYADQTLTDFEKCLRLIKAPFVIATGFTTGRLDHTLANFAVLARQIGPPTLLISDHDVAFAAPTKLALDLPIGTRLSLFPMKPMQGRSTGLKWPIDGLTIAPLGRLGTSNETNGPVRLNFDESGIIVLIPREHLDAILAEITG